MTEQNVPPRFVYAGEEEWHYVPYPEHYAEVMDTAGRGHTYEGRTEVDHRWYWEAETVHIDGMNWNTGSPIWMVPLPPALAYVHAGGDGPEWRRVDPAHPQCWACGRFFRRDKWHKERITGPCDRCDEGPSW